MGVLLIKEFALEAAKNKLSRAQISGTAVPDEYICTLETSISFNLLPSIAHSVLALKIKYLIDDQVQAV